MIGERRKGKEKGLGLLTGVGGVSTGVTRDGGEFRQVAVINFEEVLGPPLYQMQTTPPVSS
jgi:hypothetical protein